MKDNLRLKAVLLIGLVIFGLGSLYAMLRTEPTASTFVSVERELPGGGKELCSSYADLCFTYPKTWSRSSILHGSNFYGETAFTGVEINPPTGIGLYFEKHDEDTNTACKKADTCTIMVKDLQKLDNENYILSAIFSITSITPPDQDVIDRHNAFICLLSAEDVQSHGLEAGKNIQISSFNPSIQFGNHPKAAFIVRSGKGYDLAIAEHWLASDEAKIATQILKTVQER